MKFNEVYTNLRKHGNTGNFFPEPILLFWNLLQIIANMRNFNKFFLNMIQFLINLSEMCDLARIIKNFFLLQLLLFNFKYL